MKKGVRKVAAVCVAGAMALGSSVMTVGANSISLIDYSDLLEDDDLLVVEPETTAETTAETEYTAETEVYNETLQRIQQTQRLMRHILIQAVNQR